MAMRQDLNEKDTAFRDPNEGPAEAAEAAQEAAATEADEERPELDLEVTVTTKSACERHITVTIPRKDIDRYCDEAFSELMPTAAVPGFRAGRAPRKLVEHRFRKEILEQVKGSLLMDSMTQITEKESFTAIGEPEFDLDAVELPLDGPMTFEFDLEVRPDFDLPEWKGLAIERPVHAFDEQEVDWRLKKILARFGRLVPTDHRAQPGDYVAVRLEATHDGRQVASAEELVLRIAPLLSFRDGKLEGFDRLMSGVAVGDIRQCEMTLSDDASNEALRGQTVRLRFEVLEVKELELPELTPEFLLEMGGFTSVAELREAVRQDLQRQLAYHQDEEIRRQISAALTASADWDLPPTLLRRQSARELERMILELRRSGFSDSEIRARENELRQNSQAATARALKQHFILERIAEEESIDATNVDFDNEIALIAAQSGESSRRVRAQLDKRGLMDVLRNQIIERKVVDLVRSQARLIDKPFTPVQPDVEAIEVSAGGEVEESPIPEASEKKAEAEQGS